MCQSKFSVCWLWTASNYFLHFSHINPVSTDSFTDFYFGNILQWIVNKIFLNSRGCQKLSTNEILMSFSKLCIVSVTLFSLWQIFYTSVGQLKTYILYSWIDIKGKKKNWYPEFKMNVEFVVFFPEWLSSIWHKNHIFTYIHIYGV